MQSKSKNALAEAWQGREDLLDQPQPTTATTNVTTLVDTTSEVLQGSEMLSNRIGTRHRQSAISTIAWHYTYNYPSKKVFEMILDAGVINAESHAEALRNLDEMVMLESQKQEIRDKMKTVPEFCWFSTNQFWEETVLKCGTANWNGKSLTCPPFLVQG
jgi:hypothetical protein